MESGDQASRNLLTDEDRLIAEGLCRGRKPTETLQDGNLKNGAWLLAGEE